MPLWWPLMVSGLRDGRMDPHADEQAFLRKCGRYDADYRGFPGERVKSREARRDVRFAAQHRG